MRTRDWVQIYEYRKIVVTHQPVIALNSVYALLFILYKINIKISNDK